jgi:hypothetical protein
VAAGLDHREADRVPIDVGGSRVSGMSAIAYKNLLKALGHREAIKLYDIKQQLAMVSLEIAKTLGSDVVQLARLGPATGMSFSKIDRWKEGMLTDGGPCLVPEGYEPLLNKDGSVELDTKIFLHCDGTLGEIMDDLMEIGVEILNPVQTGARGMEPETLKKRYGDRLCSWGGGSNVGPEKTRTVFDTAGKTEVYPL